MKLILSTVDEKTMFVRRNDIGWNENERNGVTIEVSY
jgi:hypothetical protein